MTIEEKKKPQKTLDLVIDRSSLFIQALFQVLFESSRELIRLAIRGSLPTVALSTSGAVSVWFIVIHKGVAPLFHARYPVFHVVWVFATAIVPSLGYAAFQLALRKRQETKVQAAFTASGLTHPLGRKICVVQMDHLDSETTKLVLRNVSQSVPELQKLKEKLGTNLNAYIEEFKQHRTKGKLEMIISVGEIPCKIELPTYLGFQPASVLVGESRSGKKFYLNFDQYPHLLVAGTTGGGKSTFARHLIVTLILNSTDERFILVDLKGEAEFNTYNGLPRTDVYSDANEVVAPVSILANLIDQRMRVFHLNEVTDLDAYLKIPNSKRKLGPTGAQISMSRTYLIVDEAADLFLASSKHHPQKIKLLREDLSLIARKGRAAGIHLVLSLQKPEVRAIDAQIKSCMTSVLCFPMVTDADSISALGVGRATDLPRDVKGRAIWKLGGDLAEVQVPWLSKKKAAELLSGLRKQPETTKLNDSPPAIVSENPIPHTETNHEVIIAKDYS
jgi:energy-coupling factor transporter ATP-binding protein EcfA2